MHKRIKTSTGKELVITPIVWFGPFVEFKGTRDNWESVTNLDLELVSGVLRFKFRRTNMKIAKGAPGRSMMAGFSIYRSDLPEFVAEFKRVLLQVVNDGSGKSRAFTQSYTNDKKETVTWTFVISGYARYGEKKSNGIKFELSSTLGDMFEVKTDFESFREQNEVLRQNKFTSAATILGSNMSQEFTRLGEFYTGHLVELEKLQNAGYSGGPTKGAEPVAMTESDFSDAGADEDLPF